MSQLNLLARAYHRILKLARTHDRRLGGEWGNSIRASGGGVAILSEDYDVAPWDILVFKVRYFLASSTHYRSAKGINDRIQRNMMIHDQPNSEAGSPI